MAGAPTAWLLFIIALIPRAFYVLYAGGAVGIAAGKDAVSYDQFARLMMSGWDWLATPLAVREPLYSAFMALAYRLPGSEIGTLQLLQVLLGALAVVVLYLGLRSVILEGIAVVAALGVALHPHFILYTPEPYRENLIIPLLAATLVLFLLSMKKRSITRMFFFAFFYALLVHTDVRFLPLVAIIPVMAYAYHRRMSDAMISTVWIWVFFMMFMVPYQVRGYMAMGKPVIVTERFLGKWMDRATSVSTERSDSTSADKRQAWLAKWERDRRARLDDLSPLERDYFNAGGRPSIERWKVHRDLFIEYWRFFQTGPKYRPYPDGRFTKPWSRRHTMASSLVMVPFLLLFPFCFLGSSGRVRRVVCSLLVFYAFHCLMHVLVHARERYRIPMEIISAILIAVALINLWQFFRRKVV